MAHEIHVGNGYIRQLKNREDLPKSMQINMYTKEVNTAYKHNMALEPL